MIKLEDLIRSNTHFGHRTSRWHPKMKPFIWGVRNKIHLISPAATAHLLQKAAQFLEEGAAKGKQFLWVCTKKVGQHYAREAAEQLSMPCVVHRWIGGTLSNYAQVRKAVSRLLHLEDVVKKPLIHYKKKEMVMLNKDIERLQKNVGGIVDLDPTPGALIVVDAKRESTAVKEAIRMNIPVIAIVDSNTDPTGIPFAIPANDDSPRSISFILNYLKEFVARGKERYAIVQEKERKEKEEALKLAAEKKAADRAEEARKAGAKHAASSEKRVEKATFQKGPREAKPAAPKQKEEPAAQAESTPAQEKQKEAEEGTEK